MSGMLLYTRWLRRRRELAVRGGEAASDEAARMRAYHTGMTNRRKKRAYVTLTALIAKGS